MARSSGSRAGWAWVGQMIAALGLGVLIGTHVYGLRGVMGWPAVAVGLLMVIVAKK